MACNSICSDEVHSTESISYKQKCPFPQTFDISDGKYDHFLWKNTLYCLHFMKSLPWTWCSNGIRDWLEQNVLLSTNGAKSRGQIGHKIINRFDKKRHYKQRKWEPERLPPWNGQQQNICHLEFHQYDSTHVWSVFSM